MLPLTILKIVSSKNLILIKFFQMSNFKNIKHIHSISTVLLPLK